MSHNKLYTLSYFRKRLFNAGYSSKILIDRFDDSRYWMISIGDVAKIICVCYKDGENYYFELFDGKNKIKQNMIIHTQSMNVITEALNELREIGENNA